MSATAKKKRGISPDSTKPDLKRKKAENGALEFLSPVTAFILQAGIEKLRMQIFKSQLIKFGGTLRDRLCPEVTHLIVDDKMEADRMCRLLKLDKPPENLNIVKSSWLSACFKEKKLMEINLYLLDLSVFDVKPEVKKQDEANNEVQDGKTKEPTSELPKVGMMFGHKKNIPKQQDDEDDSDYVQSDAESEKANSEPEASSSASNTPSTSPKKALPVS